MAESDWCCYVRMQREYWKLVNEPLCHVAVQSACFVDDESTANRHRRSGNRWDLRLFIKIQKMRFKIGVLSAICLCYVLTRYWVGHWRIFAGWPCFTQLYIVVYVCRWCVYSDRRNMSEIQQSSQSLLRHLQEQIPGTMFAAVCCFIHFSGVCDRCINSGGLNDENCSWIWIRKNSNNNSVLCWCSWSTTRINVLCTSAKRWHELAVAHHSADSVPLIARITQRQGQGRFLVRVFLVFPNMSILLQTSTVLNVVSRRIILTFTS